MQSQSLKEKIHPPFHHAYIIEGSSDRFDEVVAFLNECGIETKSNPDFFATKFKERFGINDARYIKSLHTLKPTQGEMRFFVLEILSITVEAQNALLKVLEEPSGGSLFFIVTPSKEVFLPTILSRVEIIKSTWQDSTSTEEAQIFLSSKVSDRLKIAEKIAKSKDVSKAVSIVTGLEQILADKMNENPDNISLIEAMREVLKMERFVRSRSPSLKMILEHLALSVPVGKL